MTWITDDTGRRWVDDTRERKPRKAPRALRFANLKVGDQLMKGATKYVDRKLPVYYVVTDLWFDPVAGQDDPVAGQMVGYCQLGANGEARGRTMPTTLRGLASQMFHYADIDYIAMCKARSAAIAEGGVVGIGYGKVIRKRPKLPGERF